MSDEIDRLLDEALSVYAAAPDRPNLEERVLARVSEHKRRPRYWQTYAGAAALIVAALLVVWQLRVGEKPAPAPKASEVAGKDKAPSTMRQPVLLSKAVSPKRANQKRRAEPKRPVFPTPSALTPQERALVEIAQAQPDQLAALHRSIEPLEIPLIQIEPLDKRKN